jgi:hypothetical protein
MEEENKVVDPEPKKEKKAKKPIDLSKGGLIWTIWNATEAAVLIVVGILAIVFSNNQDFQKTILAIVGSLLIVDGGLKILANFLPILATTRIEAEAKAKAKAAMAYDLVIGGAFELALGITLIAIYTSATYANSMNVLVSLISTFIAIVCLVAGASLALFAVAFLVAKLYKVYMPILEIIFAAALIALGVVILVFVGDANSSDAEKVAKFFQIVLIITGVVITLTGAGLMVTTFQAVSDRKALKKEAAAKEKAGEEGETSVIEAEVTIDATKKDEPNEEKKDVPSEKEAPKDEK